MNCPLMPWMRSVLGPAGPRAFRGHVFAAWTSESEGVDFSAVVSLFEALARLAACPGASSALLQMRRS